MTFACLLVTLSLGAQQPDDCSLTFNGSTRKLVKLRSPNLASSYTKLGSHAHPKGVAWWLATVCNWETNLPATIPGSTAMPGIEDRVVTLQGTRSPYDLRAGPPITTFTSSSQG